MNPKPLPDAIQTTSYLGAICWPVAVGAEPGDTRPLTDTLSTTQRDVMDYARQWFPHWLTAPTPAQTMPTGRVFATVLPSIGYEPQTRLAAYVGGNLAFRTAGANVSSVYPTLAYTQNHQLVFHTAANVWLPGNRHNLTTDWRLMHYPQNTYGLGGTTSTQNAVLINYAYLRLYQTLAWPVAPHLYVGAGYGLDLHWAIQAQPGASDPIPTGPYDLTALRRSVSSGPTLSLLYDSRTNQLTPTASFFANMLLRTNWTGLGSDHTYQFMLLDVRKYVAFPAGSSNILAFWSYNALTLNGQPPYLDLPATGWDANNNQGRGYIQGRFRGRSLVYAETEYRFGLLASGLLGGVVFANAHWVSGADSLRLSGLLPAGGGGLRVRLNKVTRLNLAVDYAVGIGGSRGLYFNIGELF